MSIQTTKRARYGKRLATLCAWSLLAVGLLHGGGVAHGAGDGSDKQGDENLHAVYDSLAAGEKPALDGDYGSLLGPTVFLTFDDGPSTWTPKVLDILQDEGVNGTFFMLGDEAERYPDTVKRVIAEGNAVGNHTYNHVYNQLYSGFDVFWNQVQKTEGILEPLVGEKPAMVRAPGGTAGNFDAFYYYELQQAGYTVFDWNIDSGDSARVGVPAKEIIDTVRKGPFRDEVIVLMHDGSGHGETVKALRAIIGIFKEKGYSFATLSPKVPPIEFGVRKVRWSRSMSYDAFVSATTAAREHAAAMRPAAAAGEAPAGGGAGGDGGSGAAGAGDASGGDGGTTNGAPGEHAAGGSETNSAGVAVGEGAGTGGNGGGVAAESGAAGQTGPDEPALNVSVDGRSWSIQPGDYEFRQGRFAVSLNGLIHQLGGQVQHADGLQSFKATVGAYAVEYDFARLEQRVYEWGRLVRTTVLPDVKRLGDDDLRVPLRNVTELLGGRIDGYALSSGARLVAISASVRTPLLPAALYLDTVWPIK